MDILLVPRFAFADRHAGHCVALKVLGGLILYVLFSCAHLYPDKRVTTASKGALRARDPSRPLHYEGGGFLTAATDIVCPMYARIAQIRGFAAMAPPEEQRPGILCEYAHAMGNR